MNLLGQDPLSALFAAELSKVAVDAVFPLDDQTAIAAETSSNKVPEQLGELIVDRLAFRRYVKALDMRHPEFWTAETFEQFSAGILKRERFPVCLKSRRNLANGAGTYRIEGFRDLSRFWDRLQKAAAGPALVEDWIQSQVLVELTLLPDGSTMLVQAGLDQSLVCRTAWRMFPVTVPDRWKAGVEKILSAVKALPVPPDRPVRLHLGLMTGGDVVFLALNMGLNRLEYVPRWSAGCWAGRSLVSRMAGLPAGPALPKGHVARVQQLRRPSRAGMFPAHLPEPVRAVSSLKDYAACGRHAVILLSGTDPKKLAADGRTVATLLAAQDDDDQ